MAVRYFSKTVLGVSIAMAASVNVQAADTIEELVVSAQRRAETLQEIPIAINAFTNEQINSLGTSNLQELTEHIAGAELFDDRGSGQPTWVIRGVGLADFNANNTPTAAIYYDEHYLSSNVLGGIGMFDIDRVEVLKGPQGGLYGRNTSGGAVRVLSVRPELGLDTNGYVTASYGSWNRSTFEAAVGTSLGDNAAVRISGMTDQGGGWQDSLATPGDDEHGDRDFSAIKAQFLFAPSDEVQVLLKIEGGEDKSETTLGKVKALYDPVTPFILPNATNGLTAPQPVFCASALAGKADQNSCFTLSNATNVLLGSGQPGLLASQQDDDGSKVLSSPVNGLDNSWHGININVEADMGFATVTSITAYLKYDNNQVFDFDGQPLNFLGEDSETELKSWSQELRLVSNDDESDIYWLAGVSYSVDEMDDFRTGDLSNNALIFPSKTQRGFEQEAESWAVYGQVDITLSDSWKINTSLRYTDEQKDFNDAFHFDTVGNFYYIQDVNKTYDLDSNWSGHIGVDWLISYDAMIYAKVTRGFKSGGFYGGFAFGEEELAPYKEETVLSYEVGFKSDWLDQSLRINGAAFFYEYSDVQGFTQTIGEVTGTPLTKLGNTGDAEHTGVELDVNWLPLEGLSLQLGIAWLDAEITDSDTITLDPAGVPGRLEGRPRTFAPEWSTTAQIRYERYVFDNFVGIAQLNYSWRDDLAGRDSFSTDLDYAAFGQDGYEVVNARLALEPDTGDWEIALVAKNLLDEVYVGRATGDDLGSVMDIPTRPRSFALEASYRWE